jgi:hypothetical protein
MRQEQMGKPFTDAQVAAESIQPIVDSVVPGVKVQPAVIFISNKVKLDVEDPAVPVAVTRKDREPSLKALRRDTKRELGQLTLEQVSAIERAMNEQLAIVGQREDQTETTEAAE